MVSYFDDNPYDLDDSETAFCNVCHAPAYSCECRGYDVTDDAFDADDTFEREDPWPDYLGR